MDLCFFPVVLRLLEVELYLKKRGKVVFSFDVFKSTMPFRVDINVFCGFTGSQLSVKPTKHFTSWVRGWWIIKNN